MDANKDKAEKVSDPSDPTRCQAVNSRGQCVNKEMAPGTGNCRMHGGAKTLSAMKDRELKNYQLDKYKAKVARHTSGLDVLSLRDELGLTRMILEETFEACDGSSDSLLKSSSKMLNLIQNIERLVLSCQKLEKSLGEHLSKDDLAVFIEKVFAIISTEVPAERLEDVAKNILDAAGIGQ